MNPGPKILPAPAPALKAVCALAWEGPKRIRTSNIRHRTPNFEQKSGAASSRGARAARPCANAGASVQCAAFLSSLRFDVGCSALNVRCSRFHWAARRSLPALPTRPENRQTSAGSQTWRPSYFGCPKWPKPVLGMIKSPFAAAVIRHVLRVIGLVSCPPSCAVTSSCSTASIPSAQQCS